MLEFTYTFKAQKMSIKFILLTAFFIHFFTLQYPFMQAVKVPSRHNQVVLLRVDLGHPEYLEQPQIPSLAQSAAKATFGSASVGTCSPVEMSSWNLVEHLR